MNKAFVREPDTTDVLCPKCGTIGETVLRVAFETHVPPAARRPLAASVYFCTTPKCPVAYFDAFEAVVLADSLARPVHPKDPTAPLCACFGLTIEDVEADVAETVPTRIRALSPNRKAPPPAAKNSRPLAERAFPKCSAAISSCAAE